ncbi:MAG: endoribonuclease YicC domain-containing protein [Planctomycetota bacterium]|jgi:uncharacterized protein (TIGR00255 family)
MSEPISSMTGSGSAALDHEIGRFEAEARSVNHRFLKSSVRLAGSLPPLEAPVEERIRARIHRGHVTLFLRLRAAAGGRAAELDAAAFGAATERLKTLAREHGLPEPTVGHVLRTPGLFAEPRAGGENDDLNQAALACADAALDELVGARHREGTLLVAEVRRLLARLSENLQAIDARAAEVPSAAKERLHARLAELLDGSGVAPDEAQVAREAALLADRADVREEIARLQAHLVHAEELVDTGGAVGRRLDFAKADVERQREQVQNLE